MSQCFLPAITKEPIPVSRQIEIPASSKTEAPPDHTEQEGHDEPSLIHRIAPYTTLPELSDGPAFYAIIVDKHELIKRLIQEGDTRCTFLNRAERAGYRALTPSEALRFWKHAFTPSTMRPYRDAGEIHFVCIHKPIRLNRGKPVVFEVTTTPRVAPPTPYCSLQGIQQHSGIALLIQQTRQEEECHFITLSVTAFQERPLLFENETCQTYLVFGSDS